MLVPRTCARTCALVPRAPVLVLWCASGRCSSCLISYKPRAAGPGPNLAHRRRPFLSLGLGIFLFVSSPTCLVRYVNMCTPSSLSSLHLCGQPYFSQTVCLSGPPPSLRPSSTCATTNRLDIFFSRACSALPCLCPALLTSYDVGFSRHNCASLDFQVVITANQTVSPFTDSNVTAGNQRFSSHLISVSSRLTSARPIRLIFVFPVPF